MRDSVTRFLFEELDIRGSIVQLSGTWHQLRAKRTYPAGVLNVLGQMCAVTTIIAGNLKQPGRLTFQLKGHGAISLLVIDCTESLNLRGYAKYDDAIAFDTPLAELLADGRLLMSLELPNARQPYQSYVPVEGSSIAAVFEHYLEQSEQQPAALVLAADDTSAAGLFVQRLPGADLKDIDGWNRVLHLTRTATPNELLTLQPEALLSRLYQEEDVRLFAGKPVTHIFPPDWEKVRGILRSLGKTEVEQILAEHGEVVISDDLSNHEYRFTREEATALFSNEPPVH